LIYNTKTVTDLGAKAVGFTTNPRSPMRYELQPVGAGSAGDFYMYVTHMKALTTPTDVSERDAEAKLIRSDEATLPANASVIYTGDFNSSPPEAEFTDLTSAGQGQAFDPENFSTSTQWWTDSTNDMRFRDDYQMMTSNILTDTGPLQYVTGSFQVFGNNGTTGLNGMTNASSNTALGDLSNRTTVLNDLMQPSGSDHLPVVADYSVVVGPLAVTWNNAGANNLWDTTSSNWNSGSSNTTFSSGAAVTFNDNNPSNTTANYSVTLNTTVSPGLVTVNNSGGNYVISGTGGIAGTGSLSKSGTGSLTLNTVNTFTGGTSVSAGTLVVGVNGALPNGTVAITGGTLQLGTSTGLTQVTSLSISGTGALDVNNNHLIINYGAGSDPISSIAALLSTGYHGGAWNGSGGIVSTAAAANSGSYGLGYADAADTRNPAGLSAGTIEIKYTLLGDVDLNGVVNGIDFGILAANFNKGVSRWDQGDFNFDGIVNGIDFGSLAANFNQGANGAAGVAALDAFAAANGLMADVPEPGTAALVAVAAAGLLRRKSRCTA
jgi:autotransporter-associated beta strand protein